MSDPLVTVIVPIFNHAAYVLETLGSVCAQTYQQLQIIVIDDGSTDDGASLVTQNFGPRVQLVAQPNGGPSAAVNAAFRVTEGEYIAFLGGDDVCEPQRIGHQLEVLRATSHDLVFAKPQMIDMAGDPLPDSEVPVLYVDQKPGPEMYRRLFLLGNFLCGPSAMMRSRVLTELGFFHEGLVGLQDFDYWLRACGRGMSIGVDSERVVRYRRHPGNLSGTRSVSALSAETAYVLRRSLDDALPRVVRAAFPHVLPPRVDVDAPLSMYEKSLLLLAHPYKEVQAMGLGCAYDIAERGDLRDQGVGPDLKMFQFLLNTTRAT
ncbi:glycosyltransferase family 2 protein [Caballeronia telluris]|uniref:Glycosyl transferase family 2 n=1 Tax=Caballeronia telluris TaxID=326475 RepID=A0A158IYV0_9BURK|nr:glycosyltransferase family 2 protein [Caballeronia telluris]SAL61433.1 glycosyl transferase family 2 [Caballeronia telluris]